MLSELLTFAFFAVPGLMLAAFASSEMDTIHTRPQKAMIKSPWWLKNNWKRELFEQTLNEMGNSPLANTLRWFLKNKFRWWLLKYPFSFLIDGWHFCKAVMVFSVTLVVSVGMVLIADMSLIWVAPFAIALYGFFGAVFNVGYDN